MLQLYRNIKNRRLEQGLTQSDLAGKLGYSDKSMIAKIEKGLVDLPQSKIVAFANALNISASDLMGWEPTNIISDKISLYNVCCETEAESELVLMFRNASSVGKRKIVSYMQGIVNLETADFELRAAHERTDIKVTDEMKRHDDDIMNDDDF